ncbi:hypothetical protein [Actomonas aquatica]|uniref:Zinc ribbon domain-containing protein n=1 Tax=Actomonas aquatica TaxID=2866162 RepID=A0ABZ1C7U5_9BACT|nr:hypothetical protein [Opitutus sp. WL0086]WRQ87777.1 hypothetical protein K1X11_000035 [Opitutus sp. WL0086]
MMNFLWDLGQEGRIRGAEKQAARAENKTIDLASGAGSVQRRLDVMTLANQALFEILRDRLGISEEEVLYRMAEIDARDGKKDGKIAPRVVSCRRCGRKVSTARQHCMYCAEVVVEGHLYEKS